MYILQVVDTDGEILYERDTNSDDLLDFEVGIEILREIAEIICEEGG